MNVCKIMKITFMTNSMIKNTFTLSRTLYNPEHDKLRTMMTILQFARKVMVEIVAMATLLPKTMMTMGPRMLPLMENHKVKAKMFILKSIYIHSL